MKRLTVWILCCGIMAGSGVLAADLPSLERGKQLFASEKLGTSGTSCAGCHPDGKKLEGAGGSDDGELAATINRCIAGPLEGKQLAPESTEMKSLMLYLRSLSPVGK